MRRSKNKNKKMIISYCFPREHGTLINIDHILTHKENLNKPQQVKIIKKHYLIKCNEP